MEDKPSYTRMMFTFSDGSEQAGYFTRDKTVVFHFENEINTPPKPAPSEPVSWVLLSDWINERAAKPKAVEPPKDANNKGIVMTFEDGEKALGFYSHWEGQYMICPENDINKPGEKTDKRVVAWEYLAHWINARLQEGE